MASSKRKRAGGRPAHTGTNRYQIQHTAADRDAWERAAAAKRLNLSDWVRMTLAEAAGGAVRVESVEVSEVVDVAYPEGAS